MKDRGGCPCLYIEPCSDRCTCISGASSRGCDRCCSYGSIEQRTVRAHKLTAKTEEEWKKYEESARKDEEAGNAWLIDDMMRRAKFFDKEGFEVRDALNGKIFEPETEVGKRVLALVQKSPAIVSPPLPKGHPDYSELYVDMEKR